jgi:hypothetical protein
LRSQDPTGIDLAVHLNRHEIQIAIAMHVVLTFVPARTGVEGIATTPRTETTRLAEIDLIDILSKIDPPTSTSST